MKLSQTISLLGDVTLVDAVQMTANENLVEFKDGLFQDCIDLTDKNLRLELDNKSLRINDRVLKRLIDETMDSNCRWRDDVERLEARVKELEALTKSDYMFMGQVKFHDAEVIRDMFEYGEDHHFNINCSNFEERYIQPVLKVKENDSEHIPNRG